MNCPHCGKELPVDFVDPQAVEAAQEKLLKQRTETQVITGKAEGFRKVSTGFSTDRLGDLVKLARNHDE